MPDETLVVVVERHDGRAEGDEGRPYYVASCSQIGAVTEGFSFDELLHNLREVIALALEDEDTVALYNVVPNPRITITLDLPDYARIA